METILHFGPEGRLVGLLSGTPGPATAATLVLPNAGMIPRAGPFRLHVELARQLATRGTPVLRFDLPGVGEAPRLSNCSDQQAILAALDCLTERYGCTNVVIGGICSAADLGWRMALRDPRVAGVLLLDGVSFAGPWYALARLGRALRRPPRRWPGMLRRLLAGAPAATVAAGDFRDWPTRAQARIQLREMLARNMRLLFVYTGGAAEHFLDRRQFTWGFGKAVRSKNVVLHFWPDCDHLFYLRSDRDRLLESIEQWLHAT